MPSCRRLVQAAAGAALAACSGGEPPGTVEEIRVRLQPAGQVCRAGQVCPKDQQAARPSAPGAAAAGATASASPSDDRSGKQIYDQFCFVCHATGVSEAPLLGDRAQWQPRIDKGMDAMLAVSLAGLNLMPPKGACIDCSEAELRAAIQHMIDQLP